MKMRTERHIRAGKPTWNAIFERHNNEISNQIENSTTTTYMHNIKTYKLTGMSKMEPRTHTQLCNNNIIYKHITAWLIQPARPHCSLFAPMPCTLPPDTIRLGCVRVRARAPAKGAERKPNAKISNSNQRAVAPALRCVMRK